MKTVSYNWCPVPHLLYDLLLVIEVRSGGAWGREGGEGVSGGHCSLWVEWNVCPTAHNCSRLPPWRALPVPVLTDVKFGGCSTTSGERGCNTWTRGSGSPGVTISGALQFQAFSLWCVATSPPV